MTKTMTQSFGPNIECKFPWPEDCSVQCGSNGIVFTKKETLNELFSEVEKNPKSVVRECFNPTKAHYRTAFVEAFPKDPDTFLRGEGKTVEEAEEKAWALFTRYKECSGHEYEKRGYKNGAGFCKKCGMFKINVFEPEEGYS